MFLCPSCCLFRCLPLYVCGCSRPLWCLVVCIWCLPDVLVCSEVIQYVFAVTHYLSAVSHLLCISLRDLRCVRSAISSDLRCVLCCRWWSPLCSLLSLVISAVFSAVASDLRCHRLSPWCSGVQVNVWLSCRVLSVNHRCMFVPYVPHVPYVLMFQWY